MDQGQTELAPEYARTGSVSDGAAVSAVWWRCRVSNAASRLCSAVCRTLPHGSVVAVVDDRSPRVTGRTR